MTSSNPASILDSIKKVLGFDPDFTDFDLDLIMHINTFFGTLLDLGAGPVEGFVISDNTKFWSDFTDNKTMLARVQSWMYLRVKQVFDPPALSFVIDSQNAIAADLEWRINVMAEHLNPPSDPFTGKTETPPIFDGGIMTTYFAPKTVQLSYASVVTPDASLGNVFYLTLTGDCTINAPANGVDGEHITLEITSDGHSVTWGSGWNFGSVGTPTLSTDSTDVISAYYRSSANNWRAGVVTGF